MCKEIKTRFKNNKQWDLWEKQEIKNLIFCITSNGEDGEFEQLQGWDAPMVSSSPNL